MRTVVVSDLHGNVGRLERALAHASLQQGDRLIVAGDLIDIGTEDALGAAEAHGALVLAGNHEVSAALGVPISPQNPSSLRRGDEFAERLASGEWPLAVAVEGWLVTHAGVSSSLLDIVERTARDPEALADTLNAMFRQELDSALGVRPLAWDDLDRYRLIGGQLGPLWFRPSHPDLLPSGLRQIVGHTAPELLGPRSREMLESFGWLLVEPGGHLGDEVSFRYAVIENGEARVLDA